MRRKEKRIWNRTWSEMNVIRWLCLSGIGLVIIVIKTFFVMTVQCHRTTDPDALIDRSLPLSASWKINKYATRYFLLSCRKPMPRFAWSRPIVRHEYWWLLMGPIPPSKRVYCQLLYDEAKFVHHYCVWLVDELNWINFLNRAHYW